MKGYVALHDMMIMLILFILTCTLNKVIAFSSTTPSTIIPWKNQNEYRFKHSISPRKSKTERFMFVADSTLLVDVSSNLLSSSLITQSSPMILAETESWVQPLSNILGPILNVMSFAMVRPESFYF